MRSLRFAFAVLLLGAGLSLVGGVPAFGCSCVAQKPAQQAEEADVVFAGTLTDVDEPRQLPILSSGDEARYTFDIDAVYAGDVASVAVVGSAWSGASCGLEGMTVGERYVVIAYREGKGLGATLCGGTGPASPRLEGQVSNALGPATLPDPGGEPAAAGPPYPSPAAAWAWVGGLLAIGVPLWLWSRRSAG
jgi:hypothetical protein